MLNTRNQFFGLGLALALGACASAAQQDVDIDQSSGRTTLAVQNNTLEDMAIYVVNASGGRLRVGTVMRQTSGQLVIPQNMLDGWWVQLIADAIGSGKQLSFPQAPIRPGSKVELLLERNPVFSNYWVR